MKTEAGKRRAAGGRAWMVCALVLALGATATATAQTATASGSAYPPVPGGMQPGLTITLRLYNYAHVATALLVRSEGEAGAIFRQAGVETIWVDCPLSETELDRIPACQGPMSRADFVLRIRSSATTPQAAAHDDALGSALACLPNGIGCSAEVFYPRVAHWASGGDISAYQLLGHAMAHEIGHLLLGPNSHSRDGIMRPQWNSNDLRVVAQASLRFTPEEAAHLRSAVLTRSPWSQVTPASRQVTTSPSQGLARADSNSRITIWAYNYAHVSKQDLAGGERVTARVFEQAGMTLEWVDCPVSNAEVKAHPICQEHMRSSELALVILPSFSGMHLDAGHTLGFSQVFLDGSFGHYAYVSYEQVEAAARRGPALAYQILGYVAAHELGHVLLTSDAHSSSGIMRAKLEEGDFQDVAQGGLTFTPQQAQRIRDNVAARVLQRELPPFSPGSGQTSTGAHRTAKTSRAATPKRPGRLDARGRDG
jgi:hypothetical protein